MSAVVDVVGAPVGSDVAADLASTAPAAAPLALVVLVVGFVLAPRVMARATGFRRAPRPALVVWQSVALAAVLSALSLAPSVVAAFDGGDASTTAVVVATAVSVLILARLLLSGHRVGTRLRAARREHRELVDLLADSTDGQLRVLAHPTPTAYCLPGVHRRVVLSEGALQALPAEQLVAVMAHERAHLRARHDLVLEYFTVLHEAVPRAVRADAALVEVRLLIEVLADRAARRETGAVPLARALATLARGQHPESALGASGDAGSTTAARMRLLTAAEPPVLLSAAMYAAALAVVALPLAALASSLGS